MINPNSKGLATHERVLAKTEDIKRLKRAQALIRLAEGIALVKSPTACEYRARPPVTRRRALNLGARSPLSCVSLMAHAKDGHARRRRSLTC
jgi:hypothetical protein